MISLPTPWNVDPAGSAPLIERNAIRALRLVRQNAQLSRPPTLTDAQKWHRELFKGVPLPVAYYAGEFRDSDPRFPELVDYEVAIGSSFGVAARDVPAAVSSFEAAMQAAVSRLDQGVGLGATPSTVSDLTAVVLLSANAHGQWARIHPFANGNGRVARLWGNWSLLRYGLPAILRVQPRPGQRDYATAAEQSMRSDHRPMFNLILAELIDRILK